jgi:hypothetical protein
VEFERAKASDDEERKAVVCESDVEASCVALTMSNGGPTSSSPVRGQSDRGDAWIVG